MEEILTVFVAAHPVLFDIYLFSYRDIINKKNDARHKVADVVGAPGGQIT